MIRLLINTQQCPGTILPQNPWEDKMLDVSDVVAPCEPQLSEAAPCAKGVRKVYACAL
jgi:hypothetical protein